MSNRIIKGFTTRVRSITSNGSSLENEYTRQLQERINQAMSTTVFGTWDTSSGFKLYEKKKYTRKKYW